MLKIWGRIMKNGKIIKDDVVVSDIDGTYQENLKQCLIQLCDKFDSIYFIGFKSTCFAVKISHKAPNTISSSPSACNADTA